MRHIKHAKVSIKAADNMAKRMKSATKKFAHKVGKGV
jgi:hypothetical protein